MSIHKFEGLYDASTYRVWLITAPYSFEKYLFAGSEANAKKASKSSELFKDIGKAAKPQIREIKMSGLI